MDVLRVLVPTVVLLCAATSASAQLLDPPTFVPKRSDTRLRFWSVDAAARGTWELDARSLASHGSLGASRTVAMAFPLTFALGARWDLGVARREGAHVLSQRIAFAGEARWHAQSREWFGFARLAAGGAHDRAGTTFVADASLGAAFAFFELDDDPTEHLPRLWFAPEMGFSSAPGAPAASGPFARVAVTMTF